MYYFPSETLQAPNVREMLTQSKFKDKDNMKPNQM